MDAKMWSRDLLKSALVVALLTGSSPLYAQDSQEVEVVDETDLDKDVAERGEDITKKTEEMKAEDKGPLRAPIDLPTDADPKLVAAFGEWQDALTRYTSEIVDYEGTVDSIVDAEYKKRVAQVNAAYDGKIRANEAVEREHRGDAIAAFEAFLQKYPSDQRYTPDALFRLAELYFEKANDDYLLADEAYQEQMELFQAGKAPAAPTDPIRDYTATMQTFRRLITEWPDYRLLDGAYYLLAYCELQMGNEMEARALFAELIVKRPDSEFAPEAWIRIGEFHFDHNELELAKQAYIEAMKFPDSKFYDKALYKIAWTYYRQDNFDQAIKEFKRLVEYSDDLRDRTGQEGSVLRAEAVQYIAISLAEADWDLDGKKDEDFGLTRIRRYITGDKPYEREVLDQLGQYLFENTYYADAVDVYRFILAKYPQDRKNPEIHEQIILALLRDDRLESAFTERGMLNEFYGPKSDWYAYQQKAGNAEAIRYADNLVKDNLIQSATWYHSEAQKLRNEAEVRDDMDLKAQAKDRYAFAAKGYEDFLERYPNDKDFYQWNFYYAECLYYSEQYSNAHEQYRVVREMDVKNNEYQEVAAFNAVKSMELLMAEKVRSGELPAKALPQLEDARQTAKAQETAREGDERGDQKRDIKAEPIPSMVDTYVTEMDRYVVLDLKNEEDKYLPAKFAFQAAKVFYDFSDFPTARKRFEWIINKYPENEVAYLAGSLYLETYRQENDFTGLANAAERLASVIQGEQAEAIRKEVREFKLGALFKSAEQLFADKKYEQAAEEYLRLLKEAPDTPFAAKALNNAAVAYENVKRFESAMRLYERVYKEHPKDPLAAYALYRVGVNQERFFDYDNAITTYELFYDKYKSKPQSEIDGTGLDFNLDEKRGDALRSAAVLRENLQKYRDAAKAYERYAESYPSNPQAPEAAWRAIIAWEKAGDEAKMVKAIGTFNREFGGQASQGPRVLEGLMKIADLQESKRDTAKADKTYKQIISEFDSRGIQPGSPASYFAAKAKFMLVERKFDDWRRIKIKGSLNKQKQLLQDKIAGQKQLTADYEEVWGYKNLEWTMASSYRIGSLFQQFAASLYEVPIPFKEDSESYEVYRTQLEDIAIPLEDEAIRRYETTIAKAREEKIVNEWTKRTLEELNKYKPAEFPLYKDERQAPEFRTITGRDLLSVENLKSGEEEK
ncbi:MAG: tetratricopeptide repeat protein [bacterium]